jgi:DnaJ domain
VTYILDHLSQFTGLFSALSFFLSIHSARNFALNCAGADEQKVPEKVEDSKPDMTWDIKSAPKLDFDEDYYSVLEVDSKILPKDLKKAYYSIVFVYHPDRKSEVAEKDLANKQMMVINGMLSHNSVKYTDAGLFLYCN